jgi:tetratricopeptide (TPR) repeat protein
VEFDKAIAINKKSDLFHFTRADCLIYLERYYEALESCDRSLSIKRKDNDKA